MSQTIRNGQTIRVNIQTGEKLSAVAVTGSYSITVLAGTGTGTSLATSATGGTYGPYAYPLVVQIVASAASEIDYDAGVTTSIESDTVALVKTDPLTGVVIGAKGADYVYGFEGLVPEGLTSSTSYNPAIAAANWTILNNLSVYIASIGGGIINMPSGGYPISAALIPRSGVRYKGVAPQFLYETSTSVPDPYRAPNGGTYFIGDAVLNIATGLVTTPGTFDGYSANTTALGSPASSFANDGFTEAGMVDITFLNFRSGINVGANNNPGFWYSTFKVHAIGCTDYGIKMENFQNLLGTYMHTSGCVHGQRYRNASTGLNCGNSNFTHIYNQPRKNYSTFDRGILFENTLGSELNEVVVDRVQSNGNGTRSNITLQDVTNIASFNGTTTKTVDVADGSKFEVGLPVYFKFVNTEAYNSFQYGINQGKVFWVSNVTGNSIRVSTSYKNALNGTNEQVFSTGTASNLKVGSNGYAGLEFNEISGAGAVINFQVLQVDIESSCTVAVQTEGLQRSAIHLYNLPQILSVSNGNRIHVSGRGSNDNSVFSNSSANSDFDTATWKWYGKRINPGEVHDGAGNSPSGIWNNNLSVSSKNQDFRGDWLRNGAKFQVEQKTPIQLFNANFSSTSSTLNFGNAGVCHYTQTGVAGTFNLPAVTALDQGSEFEIINSSGATLTVNTSSSQLINNKAGLTSVSMLTNSTARFVATVTGATYGWALMSFSASYAAGVITGV